MKKLIAVSIVLFSSSALAEGYIGAAAEYQSTNIGDATYKQVQVVGETLNLVGDDSDSNIRIYGGYRFSNRWGVELGYTDFAFEAGKEVVISALQEEEWDAEFQVKQFDLQVTYLYPFSDKLSIKAAAGVVHHDTDFEYSYKIDNENAPDDYLVRENGSESKMGFTGSVNLSYNVWQNFDAIVGVKYSSSSLADSTAPFAGLEYRF